MVFRANRVRSSQAFRVALLGWVVAAGWTPLARAAQAGEASGETAPAAPTPEDIGALHDAMQSLWNDYAPESVKAEYELIGKEELLALLARVDAAGKQEDLAQMAAYAPETRAAIEAIRALPDYADYADWLREQLADMEAAGEAAKLPPPVAPPTPPSGKPGDGKPKPPVARRPGADIPLYEMWLGRVGARTRPAQADALLPVLQKTFAAEGVPESLVWLAEVESSFNPKARSPVGARGLFQLMPDTAKALGLSLLPFDQRTNPELSARAAAVYLKKLHARFGDWPLALAAYNAGEGRVGRLLKAQGAKDFAGIVEHLPAETKLYVPKVLATVQVRAGVTPEALAAPRK